MIICTNGRRFGVLTYYFLGDQMKKNEMGWTCSHMVEEPEGKRLHGRRRRRWENNIKLDLQEAGLIWLRIGADVGLL